ncbi:unnamed protein product [Linum trigynum]|uniref:Uncharacterized protein n=1 Tax=Linum trigynum TaxID=586398 RepID=A0AAV2GH41_9ROSI
MCKPSLVEETPLASTTTVGVEWRDRTASINCEEPRELVSSWRKEDDDFTSSYEPGPLTLDMAKMGSDYRRASVPLSRPKVFSSEGESKRIPANCFTNVPSEKPSWEEWRDSCNRKLKELSSRYMKLPAAKSPVMSPVKRPGMEASTPIKTRTNTESRREAEYGGDTPERAAVGHCWGRLASDHDHDRSAAMLRQGSRRAGPTIGSPNLVCGSELRPASVLKGRRIRVDLEPRMGGLTEALLFGARPANQEDREVAMVSAEVSKRMAFFHVYVRSKGGGMRGARGKWRMVDLPRHAW